MNNEKIAEKRPCLRCHGEGFIFAKNRQGEALEVQCPDFCDNGLVEVNLQANMHAVAGTPRRFSVIRKADVTNHSGTGKVLDGVVFPCGKVVICWDTAVKSVNIYDTYEQFDSLHTSGHPENKTEMIWLD